MLLMSQNTEFLGLVLSVVPEPGASASPGSLLQMQIPTLDLYQNLQGRGEAETCVSVALQVILMFEKLCSGTLQRGHPSRGHFDRTRLSSVYSKLDYKRWQH